MFIKPNDHILFYGDSITDCGRNYDDAQSFGGGYVNLIASTLLSRFPDWNLLISNKGISGNRIYDLEDRLENDVLALEPTVVSFLVGINDTWRRYDQNRHSPIEEFQSSYRRILQKLAASESKPRVILCEPFVLPVPEDRRKWREDLDPRIFAIRELAWEFSLPYLPLDGLFAAAAAKTGPGYWLPDGVHPSRAGHGFIAGKWLELAAG